MRGYSIVDLLVDQYYKPTLLRRRFNGGTAVNFSAGIKDVFVTYPAEKAIYQGNLPTKLVVTKRDTTTADIALVNGVLPEVDKQEVHQLFSELKDWLWNNYILISYFPHI